MKALSHASHQCLGLGCGVRKVENGDSMLLLGGGSMWLKGTAAEIIRLWDGEDTLAEILRAMQAHYPSSDPDLIESEIEFFLNRVLERGAVDFQ